MSSDAYAAWEYQRMKREFLTVIQRLDNLQPSECLAQEQSPLFSMIPAEIRDIIFSYCLAEQDGRRRIDKQEYFYRPDYTHYRFIDTALLTTCRRIFLETRMIPVQNVTFREFLGYGRRAPVLNTLQYRFLSSLFLTYHREINPTIASLSRPKHIQFFTHMYDLQTLNYTSKTFDKIRSQKPTSVTLTVRYTDWYWWEDNAKLQMNNVIFQQQKWPKCIEILNLELETRNGKRTQLEAILREVSKWVFDLDDLEEEAGPWPVTEPSGYLRTFNEWPFIAEIGPRGDDGPVSETDEGGEEEEEIGDQPEEEEEQLPPEEEEEEDVPHDEDGDNEKMILVPTGTRNISTWIGGAEIGGVECEHHKQEFNGTTDLGEDEMMYYVVKLTWKKISVAQHKKERRERQKGLRRERSMI